VVPDVGNVRDPATDGDNALVVADNAVEPMATAVQRLLTDEALRSRLATNATDVREDYSYDAAAADWRGILEAAGVYTSSSESTVESPAVSS
jgi:glycosyltransferase involved in cell wall biosynthesis